MNIKFYRHVGNYCPAELRFDDTISAYLADGKWWIGSATALDWTSGAADSPLCWARGMVFKTWAAPMVADALVKLTNSAEPVAAQPDDWIEWHGGECPVPAGTLVDVRHKNGREHIGEAAGKDYAGSWNYSDHPGCIVAYRLHKPQASAPQPVADADGWIEWDGSDTPPLPGDHLVDYRLNCGLEFEHREVADINWQGVSAYRPLAAPSAVDGPAYDPASVAFKRAPLDADAKFYLSGPMSGMPELNFPAFHAAAKLLRGMGLQIVNPAEQTAVPDGSAWADYMRHDIGIMMACKGVIMLPGWQNSEGAKLEHHIAEALGMPVLSFGRLPHAV